MIKGMKSVNGFTLIEVLIAVLALSIGLLGLADLLIFGTVKANSVYLRTQANFLIYDMLDRIRANEATALTGGYTTSFDTAPSGTTNCETATCDAANRAVFDLNQWKCSLGKWNTNSVCINTLSIVGHFIYPISCPIFPFLYRDALDSSLPLLAHRTNYNAC